MSDANLRERKRTKADETLPYDSEDRVAASASTFRVPIIAYIALVLVVLGTVYLFPDYVKLLLEPWIDFSEPPLPGVNPDSVIDFTADVVRRDAVVDAFKHAWLAYERDAMGADEYHPLSHRGSNLSVAGGIGYTVVDSLDTMLIMGLHDEAARARDWVQTYLSFERDGKFNTFETTIRVLGGLLSAHHLSGGDALYLERAIDLADRMMPAFDTASGLPVSMVNLALREGVSDTDNGGLVSTAEVATLQLEFRYLSMLTDEDVYWRAAEKVMAVIRANKATPQLASIYMDPKNGLFVSSPIRLGSRGDSYYEYLLKQYLQTGRTEDVYREMYDESMDAIHEHLVQRSTTSHLTYTSELIPERTPTGETTWRLSPKQDHLVCFLGGSLMLGATTARALADPVSVPPRAGELTAQGRRDWATGVALADTCVATHNTLTGLAPEIVHFRIPADGVNAGSGTPNDWYIKGARPGAPPPLDARYILRPETVETLFIAFRLTGDKRYRDHGWKIFQAIEKHCRVESGGYVSVTNVDELPARHEDKMETFWMSETLKYLYLLFTDADVLPLSEYVFNTEAHPFPILRPSIRTGFT